MSTLKNLDKFAWATIILSAAIGFTTHSLPDWQGVVLAVIAGGLGYFAADLYRQFAK